MMPYGNIIHVCARIFLAGSRCMYQGGVPKVSEAQEVGAGDKDCHAHGRIYAIALFNAEPHRGGSQSIRELAHFYIITWQHHEWLTPLCSRVGCGLSRRK